MASEVEETLKRLVGHKGVIGTIVVNNEGVPIKSTLDNATTVQYSGLLNNLVDQAKTMFKELDPTNDLTFLRIRTKVSLVTVLSSSWYYFLVLRSTRSWLPRTGTTSSSSFRTHRMPSQSDLMHFSSFVLIITIMLCSYYYYYTDMLLCCYA